MAITWALVACDGKETHGPGGTNPSATSRSTISVVGTAGAGPAATSDEASSAPAPGEGEGDSEAGGGIDGSPGGLGPDLPAPALEIPALICSYPWPCAEALAVVYGPTPPNPRAPGGCPNGESGGNAGALSPSGVHVGLFQLHAEWHGWRVLGGPRRRISDPAELELARVLFLDPLRNIDAAFALWSESGWTPWSCKP